MKETFISAVHSETRIPRLHVGKTQRCIAEQVFHLIAHQASTGKFTPSDAVTTQHTDTVFAIFLSPPLGSRLSLLTLKAFSVHPAICPFSQATSTPGGELLKRTCLLINTSLYLFAHKLSTSLLLKDSPLSSRTLLEMYNIKMYHRPTEPENAFLIKVPSDSYPH